ncbi:hypothetical protein [Bradyrhizobium sp. SZCCHNS1054]|uniref:hypothetical protein n=1 Tax=Bradyrhizobium sp. SZCCHNS1054 TaxID=3057301 RepID=UPI002915D33F|nr:hypothetical protein [Bradyrhizobium sp. SZCCHNS1054]
MSYDLLGPSNAPNAVTARPDDTRSGSVGAADTWFKDCTSAAAGDGTKVLAAWLNGILGQVRNAIRGNGNTATTSQPVVTENDANDSMLLNAMQHLIQRGQPNYGVDTGTAGSVVVTLSPAPPEYKAGMHLRVKMAYPPAGPTVINCNGLGFKSIVHSGGVALSGSEWKAGDVVEMNFDGTNFQIVNSGVTVLATNTSYYVNPSTGSDSNNGLTAGTAWSTLQHAANWIQKNLDFAGYTVTVYCADGTYTAGASLNGLCRGQTGPSSLLFQGNHATPTNCPIQLSSSGQIAFNAVNGAQFSADGFYTLNMGGTYGQHINTYGAGSIIQGGAWNFGPCGSSGLSGGHVEAAAGSTIYLNSNYTISGGGNAHIVTSSAGQISAAGLTVTVTGTPAFTVAFASAQFCGSIFVQGSTYVGAVTGSRYYLNANGVIWTNGAGVNLFPGSTAGTTASGGQYL